VTRQGAERALVVSALVVAGTYAYRLVTEGHSSKGGSLTGIGAPPNVGRFVTGWGFAFLVLAIITEASPPFGGALSILVASGDVLANFGQVAADVSQKTAGKAAPLAAVPVDAPAGSLVGQHVDITGVPSLTPTPPKVGQVSR
jgi:hypothetical protein